MGVYMEKACKDCKYISKGESKCPLCGSERLTDRWSGEVIIVNPEVSEIAKKLGVKSPGRYAAKLKE